MGTHITVMDSHLDQLFAKGAAQKFVEMAKGEYTFRIIPMGYMNTENIDNKTGRCRVLGVRYNKSMDCNIYHLLNVDTDEEFSVDQFEVELKEV